VRGYSPSARRVGGERAAAQKRGSALNSRLEIHARSPAGTRKDGPGGSGTGYEKLVEALVEALASLQPAKIGFAAAEAPGVAFNRIRKDGPVDHMLRIMAIQDAGSKLKS